MSSGMPIEEAARAASAGDERGFVDEGIAAANPNLVREKNFPPPESGFATPKSAAAWVLLEAQFDFIKRQHEFMHNGDLAQFATAQELYIHAQGDALKRLGMIR